MTSSGLFGTDANILSGAALNGPAGIPMPQPAVTAGNGFAEVMSRLECMPGSSPAASPSAAATPELRTEIRSISLTPEQAVETAAQSGNMPIPVPVQRAAVGNGGTPRNLGQPSMASNAKPGVVNSKPESETAAEGEIDSGHGLPESGSASRSRAGEQDAVASVIRSDAPPLPTVAIPVVELPRVEPAKPETNSSDVEGEAVELEQSRSLNSGLARERGSETPAAVNAGSLNSGTTFQPVDTKRSGPPVSEASSSGKPSDVGLEGVSQKNGEMTSGRSATPQREAIPATTKFSSKKEGSAGTNAPQISVATGVGDGLANGAQTLSTDDWEILADLRSFAAARSDTAESASTDSVAPKSSRQQFQIAVEERAEISDIPQWRLPGRDKKSPVKQAETENQAFPSWQLLRTHVRPEESSPGKTGFSGFGAGSNPDFSPNANPAIPAENQIRPMAKLADDVPAVSGLENTPVASAEQARLACPEPKITGSAAGAVFAGPAKVEGGLEMPQRTELAEKANKTATVASASPESATGAGRRFSPSKTPGTPAAQQAEAMCFDGHQPEIAGSKLAARASREFSTLSRADAVEALVLPQTQPQPEPLVNRESLSASVPGDVRRPLTPQMERLAELVSVEATILRQFKPGALTAVVRPDPSSEIRLELRMHRGQVEAHAVLEKGDPQAFAAGWEELQKSLRAQGVELQPLADASSRSASSSTDDGQRRQSSGREANERESKSWPLGGLPEVLKSAVTGRSGRVSPATGGTRHLLESWA